MSNAVIYDYFSFMSDKSDKSDRKAGPPDPRVIDAPATPTAPAPATPIWRPNVAERVQQQSQIEVTESTLSDTVIERMFRRPNAG